MREYGTGNIFERRSKDGKVSYQVRVRLPDGGQKTTGTVGTRREAARLARQGQVRCS